MEHRGRMGLPMWDRKSHVLAKRGQVVCIWEQALGLGKQQNLRSLHKPKEGLLSLPCPFLTQEMELIPIYFFKDQHLENVKHYKYLRVDICDDLNMDTYIRNVYKKANYKVNMFSKIRKYITTYATVMIYKQSILPYLLVSLWIAHTNTHYLYLTRFTNTAPNTMICGTVYTKRVRKNTTSKTLTSIPLYHCTFINSMLFSNSKDIRCHPPPPSPPPPPPPARCYSQGKHCSWLHNSWLHN